MKLTESQFIKMESELEKMGWVRMDCGGWSDPFDYNLHYPSDLAYKIAMQRRKKKKRIIVF